MSKDRTAQVPDCSDDPTSVVESSAGVHRNFNLLRVRLAYVEQSAASRLELQHVADFFGQEDPDGPQLSFIEKLMSFRAAGHTVGIACTKIGCIIMPTDDLLTYLKRTQGCDTFRKLSYCVSDRVPQYKLLFHDPAAFMDVNPSMLVEEILNIMDSFVRYTSNMSMRQATLRVSDSILLCLAGSCFLL